MRKSLAIDLTDISEWSGYHGGTQRVVYGLSKAFFLSKSDIKIDFFKYNPERHIFETVNFENLLERIEPNEYQNQLTLTRNAIKKVTSKIKSAKNREFKFHSDQVVLVAGASWQNTDFQTELSLAKKDYNFTLAQVVFDLIICLYPHLHHPANKEMYNIYMQQVIENSDILLPISKSTKKDLAIFATQQKLNLPMTKVIRLGDEIAASEKRAKVPHKDFILCVGTVEIRKNHTLLYYAYKLAAERKIDLPNLIIVGGGGWYTDDIKYLINNDPEVKNKIKILHDCDDEELSVLYDTCLFTIYPSMYEGLGLPVAESLSRGKPCLASHSSSIPEIGNDLVDYFSPYDAGEVLKKIRKYLDADFLSNKSEKIKNK